MKEKTKVKKENIQSSMSLKETKGITVIGLIVTIIVLVIIAGITINAVKGDEGIIMKTENSKETYEIGQYKDIIQVARESANKAKLNNETTNYVDVVKNEVKKESGIKENNVTGDEERIQIETNEGYLFKVTDNAVNLIKTNQIEFIEEKNKITIKRIEGTGKGIQYKVNDSKEWITDTNISEIKIDVQVGDTVYARPYDGKNVGAEIDIYIENTEEVTLTVKKGRTTIGTYTGKTGEKKSITIPLDEKYIVSFKKEDGENSEAEDQIGSIKFNGFKNENNEIIEMIKTKIPNTYVYTFGSSNETMNLDFATTSVTLPILNDKEGYEFGGWKDENGNEYNGGAIYTGKEDVTLYEKWNILSFNVTYNYGKNGGTSTTKESDVVEYNSSIDLDPQATKSGWEHIGWNIDPKATEGLDSLTMKVKDVELYAIYKKVITATCYSYNNTSTNIEKTIYNGDTSVTLTLPEISGQTVSGVTYNGRGWSTSTTANATINVASKGIVTLTSNAKYYASYSGTVTVQFYYHGGTDQYANTQSSASVSGTRYMNYAGTYVQSSITIPTSITSSTGYYGTTYKGVSSSTGSTTAATVNTANTKYYAYYQVGVTLYYYNGSSHTSTTITRNATSNGSNYVTSAASTVPTPSTYNSATFKGWTYNVSNASSDYQRTLTNTAATTLYAYYQKTITVTYGANSGTGAPSASTGTLTYISKSGGVNTNGASITLSSTAPTRTGYVFSGWNTNTSGTGTNYTKGTNYTFTANTPIYAKWTKVTISVGGSNLTEYWIPNSTGKTLQLKTNASGVTWSSSNTSIATVNSNGLVSRVGPGKAVITVQANSDSSASATINIYVYNATFSRGSWWYYDRTIMNKDKYAKGTVSGTQYFILKHVSGNWYQYLISKNNQKCIGHYSYISETSNAPNYWTGYNLTSWNP